MSRSRIVRVPRAIEKRAGGPADRSDQVPQQVEIEHLKVRVEQLTSTPPPGNNRLEAARRLSNCLMPLRTNSYDPTRPSKGWRSAFEAILSTADIQFRQYDLRILKST